MHPRLFAAILAASLPPPPFHGIPEEVPTSDIGASASDIGGFEDKATQASPEIAQHVTGREVNRRNPVLRVGTDLPPRLIGISGQKGCGKDLLGLILTRLNPEFSRAAFADGLKHEAAEIFGVEESVFHDPDLKESPFLVPIFLDSHLLEMQTEIDPSIEEAGCIARTPRALLQKFGTEYVRAANPDFWVERLMSRLHGDTVVTDVRFANEAEAIKRAGGVVIRLIRDHRVDPAEHSSEELHFSPDAIFFAKSGDIAGLRGIASAALALVNAPRFLL